MNRQGLCFGLLTLLVLVLVCAAFFGAMRFAYDRGYSAGVQSQKDLHVVTMTYRVDDLIGTKAGKPDFEPLMQRLKEEIDPPSWHGDGPGWVHPFETNFSLVITQSMGNHSKIAYFLAVLRERQKP